MTGNSGPVRDVRFSSDCKHLVSAGHDRSIKVWDADTGNLIRSSANAPAICASGSDDQTVRIWQPATGRMVRIIREHEGAILALAYNPSGERLFSAGEEGVVRIIDAASDRILQQWQAHDDWIYSLAVHPNGLSLAAGDWKGRVKLWSLPRINRKSADPDHLPELLWASPK